MEAASVAPARTRVTMVNPRVALVTSLVADLRATADGASELVDQLHWKERARVLSSTREWHYVQADDHYFGWIRHRDVMLMPARISSMLWVGVALAPVHEEPDERSQVIDHVPAGTMLAPRDSEEVKDGWIVVVRQRPTPDPSTQRPGYVSINDAVDGADIPQRPPTAEDLIATAEAFLGVPYLWGGTTALGLDCSGYVQQVYRLNGILLDRDADQQATEGRQVVGEARAGDLLFFGRVGADPGDPRITHVALSLGGEAYLNAPEQGRKVERGTFSSRKPRFARRYLPDPE